MANTPEYLPSSYVTVFPAGYRGQGYGISKLTTEENLTRSAILSANLANQNCVFLDPANNDNLILFISNYFFCIPKSQIRDDADLYAYIKFKTISGVGKVLDNIASTGNVLDSTDETPKFQGLKFQTTAPSGSDIAYVQVKANSQILTKNLRLDSTEVRNGSSNNSISTEFTTGAINNLDASDIANTGIKVKGNLTNAQLNLTSNSKLEVTSDNALLVGDQEHVNITINPPSAEGAITINTVSGTYNLPINVANEGLYVASQEKTSSNITSGWLAASSTIGNGTILRTNNEGALDGDLKATSFNGLGITTSGSQLHLPNNATLHLPTDATAANKALVQATAGSSSWLTYTDANTENTLVSRDANGVSKFKDAYITEQKAAANTETALKIDSTGKVLANNLTTADPTASGNTISFIDTISQDAKGKITATKKTVSTATSSSLGLVKGGGTASGKNYPVTIDANGVMMVNVPWTYTDTKNTAGSTNSTSKLFLIGAASQAANPQTYSNSAVYATKGQLTASSFVATSDIRKKENITDYIPEKSILDLPIKKYDFIDGPKNQIGCIAQDLQQICPEIVKEEDDGFLGIQESKLIYLLLDEVKKLKARVDELENK